LNTGNVWVYKQQGGYPYNQCYTYIRYAITGTIQINGKTYYQLVRTVKYDQSICQLMVPSNYNRLYYSMRVRLDTVNGNIYTSENCGGTPNVLCDSLASRKNDSSSACYGIEIKRETCTDTGTVSIFGLNKKFKSFGVPHASGSENLSYAEGIGLYYTYWGESSFWWSENLKGCVINGMVYGDTGMVLGINKISSKVPENFSLFQNYPNPFNPVTKIQFAISSVRQRHAFDVQLIIYDILGREVAVLVNEQLLPGTYEVEWDGTNYTSGVYYYTLSFETFTQTKRMVLIK
jgi:hypothetical protein